MPLSREDLLAMQEAINGAGRERAPAVRRVLARRAYGTWAEWRESQAAVERTLAELAPYDRVTDRAGDASWFVFMNHGYAPPDDELARFGALTAEDELWRHQVFFYMSLLTQADALLAASGGLAGRHLLEAGSGRGGGVSVAQRYFAVGRAVGLDIHPEHVAFCHRRYRDSDLEFLSGNALAMPFADASFDVVISVESSHCYPSLPSFLKEAGRVLKPGGLLLLADVRTNSALARFNSAIRQCGLRSIACRDITSRVHQACAIDIERFARIFPEEGGIPGRVAARASRLYAKGALTYVACVLERPPARK